MLENKRPGNKRYQASGDLDADGDRFDRPGPGDDLRSDTDWLHPPSGIDPDDDPRWSVQIPSAEDDGLIADEDFGYRDGADEHLAFEESAELDGWPADDGGRRAWSRFRVTPMRAAALVAIVALLGFGLRFGLPFNGGEDLAAVGLESSSTTSAPQTADSTSEGAEALAATADVGASALPQPAADGSEGDGTAPDDDGSGEAATGEATSADSMTADDGTAEPDGTTTGPGADLAASGDYASNLALIQGQTIRNRNEDASPHRMTPSAQLVPENHYGPRAEYLATVDGNKEPSYPVPNGGQFRVVCEFSHFAYDDPLVFPGQPGASHLHMFFGNTDANAFSTADSIRNTGGATCNGSELNRTAYWVPALFDNRDHVRIPERIVVYYKGEGQANGKAEVFPEGAAMIASVDINTIEGAQGGTKGVAFSYNCSDNYSGANENLSNTMPVCDGNRFINQYGVNDPYPVLEINVKFPQCWNGQDPGNPSNFRHPQYATWHGSVCEGEYNRTLVNLEYFVNYRLEPGETTEGWHLSSDVSPTERAVTQTPGSTIHGDWWGGWHKETNQMFLDNCVNYRTSVPSGCGHGYLTDGGPNNAAPFDGPALELREQYLGPMKVPAADIYGELCPNGGALTTAAAAAYCNPVAPTSDAGLFCNVHQGMYANDPRSPLNV